jgi:hypothetical protein
VSGLVRIGFCDDTTGDSVGYGLVRYQDVVDCEGVITSSMVREYFDLTDVTQGATLPVGWVVCEEAAAAAGGGVALNDLDGTALVAGNTVSRGVVDFDGVPYPTDGNGRQVIELSTAISSAVGQAGFMGANLGAAAGTSYTTPDTAVMTVNNPSNGRTMVGIGTQNNFRWLNPLNAGGRIDMAVDQNINGGGFGTTPAQAVGAFGAAYNKQEAGSGTLFNQTIPAGGSYTYQFRLRVTVVNPSAGSLWTDYSGATYFLFVTV